jgi:hypothetical protein
MSGKLVEGWSVYDMVVRGYVDAEPCWERRTKVRVIRVNLNDEIYDRAHHIDKILVCRCKTPSAYH